MMLFVYVDPLPRDSLRVRRVRHCTMGAMLHQPLAYLLWIEGLSESFVALLVWNLIIAQDARRLRAAFDLSRCAFQCAPQPSARDFEGAADVVDGVAGVGGERARLGDLFGVEQALPSPTCPRARGAVRPAWVRSRRICRSTSAMHVQQRAADPMKTDGLRVGAPVPAARSAQVRLR